MPSYNYEDEEGNVLYRVVRYGRENKQFKQEHPDGDNWTSGRGVDNKYPYHLPEVLAGIDEGKPVWILEGEKDVETARLQGLIATCNSGGSGKWTDSMSMWLRGAEPIYIVWDRDGKGRAHALAVEQSLRSVGISDIRFKRAVEGNDFTDHIEAGRTVEELKSARPKSPNNEDSDSGVSESEDFLPAAFQLALSKLNKVSAEYGKPNQYNALCPAHDDTSPSLSIRPGDDVAVMVICHANGCSPASIAQALGINPEEFTIFPARQQSEQDKENERAYMRKKAAQHADQRLAQERSTHIVEFGDREDTVIEELAKPLEPIKWLADTWFKYGTSTILNADPKAGKTRLALNLVQALTEESDFLGRYQTNWPDDARAWYGNWDMPEELMREYLHDYTWSRPDRFIMQNINSMEFPFWVPSVFDDFVQYALRMNIHLMVVDTLHVASQGFVTDSNSNDEVSEFIHLLLKLKEAAAIPHLLVIHHTGHGDKSRGRGASTLAADFDSSWFLRISDQERFDSPRSLGAHGRSVGVAPVDLVYDEATESYSIGEAVVSGSEKKVLAMLKSYCGDVASYHSRSGHWPRGKVARSFLKGTAEARTDLMQTALGRGFVIHNLVAGRSYEVQVTDKAVSEFGI